MDIINRLLLEQDEWNLAKQIQNNKVRDLTQEALNASTSDFDFISFTEGDEDYTIINYIQSGDYRLEVTFIKEDFYGDWLIEKGHSPLRNSGKKDLFTLNKNTNQVR